MSIRICIFEDHKQLRESLQQFINNSEGFSVTGIFPNCKNLEADLKNAEPEVVLMDIQMPGISGIEAIRKIREKDKELKIIVQTNFEDDDKIFSAICAGANGYILKSTEPEKYIEAIRDVISGGAPLSPGIAMKVLKLFQLQNISTQVNTATLSEREKEILSLLVKGLSYKMIAAQCSISYDTVRFHIKNIYSKLQVTSMTEAVALAIRQKLV